MKNLPISFLIPISSKNFNLRKNCYNLCDGISIEFFPKHKVQSIADRLRNLLSPDDSLLIDSSNIYLYVSFLETKKATNHDEWIKDLDKRLKKINRMLLAFFLSKFIDLWVNPILIFHGSLENHSPYYSREYLNLYRLAGTSTEMIDEKDIPLIIEMYKRINIISTYRSKPSRLFQAINFYWLARTTRNLDLAFVSFVISLEALLLTGGLELNHKFAERGAHIIGKSKKEKYHIFRTLHDSYKFRSKVVHGTLHLEYNNELYILMLKLIKIAGDCIRAILMNDNMLRIFGISLRKTFKRADKFFNYLVCGFNQKEAIENALKD